jgi:hypothetical protein
MKSEKPNIRVTNLLDEPVTIEWGSRPYTLKGKESKVFEGAVARQFLRRARFKRIANGAGGYDEVERLSIEEVTGETEIVEKAALLTYDGQEITSQAQLDALIEAKVLAAQKSQGADDDDEGDDEPASGNRRRGGRRRKEQDPDTITEGGNGDAG